MHQLAAASTSASGRQQLALFQWRHPLLLHQLLSCDDPTQSNQPNANQPTVQHSPPSPPSEETERPIHFTDNEPADAFFTCIFSRL